MDFPGQLDPDDAEAVDTSDPAAYARKLGARYLGELRIRGNSIETVRSYTYSLGVFLDFLKGKSLDFRQVKYKELISYLQTLRVSGKSEATISIRLSVVSSWYRWMMRMEIVARNPVDTVGPIKVHRPARKFYSEADAQRLLSAAETYPQNRERNIALLQFLYASGCRRSEVANLDMDDLSLNESYPHATVRHGKGNKDRIVILGDHFRAAWEAYLPIRARVLAKWERPQEKAAFVTCTGKRLDPETIYYLLGKLCRHAQLKFLGPHAIRHSAATHMLNGGADLMDIKEQLGHNNLNTTQGYLHVAIGRRAKRYMQSHPNALGSPSSALRQPGALSPELCGKSGEVGAAGEQRPKDGIGGSQPPEMGSTSQSPITPKDEPARKAEGRHPEVAKALVDCPPGQDGESYRNWINALLLGKYAPRSILQYAIALRRLIGHMRELGVTFQALKRETIDSFLSALWKQGKPSIISYHTIALANFLSWRFGPEAPQRLGLRARVRRDM